MKRGRLFFSFMVVFMIMLVTSACENKGVLSFLDNDHMIEITDDIGRTVLIPEAPEKIIPLSPTLINVLYNVGGEASARTTKSNTPIPEKAEHLEEVGMHFNLNIEKIISLKPDLLIGQVGLHERHIPIFEENNIPVVIFDIETYADSVDKIRKISKMVGTKDKGEALIKTIDQRIKAVVDQLPNEKKRVAILYVTSQDVTVELEKTVAGDTATILNFENVALSPKTKDFVRVPFSMEEIAKQDPDIIFITARSPAKEVAMKRDKVVMNNPAWAQLRAVKEGHVYDLPSDLFVVCPATTVYEPIEYMAQLIYPEIYGDIQN